METYRNHKLSSNHKKALTETMQGYGFCLSHSILLLVLSFIYPIEGCPLSIQFNCPDHAYDNGKTQLSFPFTNSSLPSCGRCVLICNEHNQTQINCMGTLNANYLLALDIIPSNRTIVAEFPDGLDLEAVKKAICIDPEFDSSSQSVSFAFVDGFETYIRCPYQNGSPKWDDKHYHFCGDDYNLYGPYENGQLPKHNEPLPNGCSSIKIPNMTTKRTVFSAHYTFSGECKSCLAHGGRCHDASKGKVDCDDHKKRNGKRILEVILFSSFSGIAAIVVLLVIYWQRRKLIKCSSTFPSTNQFKKDNRIFETVVKSYASHTPKRYTYSEIKKMTNSLGEKLGEGGFGGVYKGKLLDGRLVAVKLLKNSKGEGEGFVNEVASIGRTNHVNIVTLLGFCFEGRKRALVYEYMANGSLEKFRHGNANNGQTLPFETLFQIVLGIARGLEYLHRGCKTRILHFDIKPHNILLDEDFCPKISDFGLAKLTPRDKQSKISMSGARGTIGYIAPEVFCRNIGEVSHKSDVYSYGMMVLEMIGSRNKTSSDVESSSDIYFPRWVYKELENEKEVEAGISIDESHMQLKRKMIVVSLWCIQVVPSSRPSMSRVVQMLEGRLESIDVPPVPEFPPPPRVQWDPSCTSSTLSQT